MQAYHNDPRIKAMYLARVEAHRVADQIEKGYYWQKGKGCAVGCTIHSSDHATYETELGIPMSLAYLEDRLFEMQSNAAAMAWPEQFLQAIPVGADLSHVADHLMLWLMEYVTPFANARALPVIQRVQSLYERKVRGAMPTPDEWRAAYASANAAAAASADASADAAAVDAAAYAAYAAYAYANAAAYAADAASAAAYANANAASAETISAKLLELLAAAPVATH